MASIQDDRGYNQGFKPSKTMEIRTKRRSCYLMSKMDLSKHNDILEIGCGLGDISYYIAGNSNSNVLGTDICEPFIKEAREKYIHPNLQYDVLDFSKPEKLHGRKFDYIIGNGILHHLYNTLDNALLDLKSLLKDGGKIIFIEPNLVNPYCYLIFNTTTSLRRWAKLEPDEMAFTKCLLKKKLSKAGYKNIELSNIDFLLPVTPEYLVKPTIVLGNIVEKIPVLKLMAQSIFLCAEK